MEPPFLPTYAHPTAQPFAPMFPAQTGFDSAVYGGPPVSQPPPPPPKWQHSKDVQNKRGTFNNRQNFRVPSSQADLKHLRQQNAKRARQHFKGPRPEKGRNVASGPVNASSSYLQKRSGRRGGARGRSKQHSSRKRNEIIVKREQTPSTIQQTPNAVAERLRVPAAEAGWTAGSDTLTSAEVAMGSNFDPLGSCMLLKSEYNTDEEDDDDDNDSSTGNSDVEEEQSMPQPGTQAYQRLPSAVRQRLEQLAGQVESLIDENQKLKERLELETVATAVDGMCENSEMSAEDC